MKVVQLEVGQLKSNCYLVINEKTEECLIIDPGDDADYIQRVLNDEDVAPVALLVTHGHFDHVMAVTELKLAYNIPFLMNSKDQFLLDRMVTSAKHFTGVDAIAPPGIDTNIQPGKLEIGHAPPKAMQPARKWKLEILSSPGHSPGSVSIYLRDENAVFVGDLVFADGYVGRTDFKYADKSTLDLSIKKILKLPPNTVVYPGHGRSTSVGEIQKLQEGLDL